MPRFFDLPAEEKLRVIFHELYHINPSSTVISAVWQEKGRSWSLKEAFRFSFH
jgi:predicted metallopeptidase